ncbi:sensor histidine kinase [Microbispora bryophytorum]|uniref:sensor histidine kinase n=1 Tax=Microbispora bryophytorum TaxID=1460882 RepID=UPI0033E2B490
MSPIAERDAGRSRIRRGPGPGAACERPGGAATDAHAWKTSAGWELLFGLTLAVTAAFVAVTDAPVAARAAAVGGLAVLTVAYVLLGRRSMMLDGEEERRALLYWALVVTVFVPATLLVSSVSFALFALCPQAFMMLRVRHAVVVVLILNLAPICRFLVNARWDRDEVVMFAGSMALILTFALVFGPWITRIIEQSAERARLITELESSRAEIARLSAERGALTERERLAGEIHDTLAQGLTSIIMLVQAAQAQPDPSRHLALAVRTARENLTEARGLIEALTPAPLDGSTLEEALRRVTARLGEEAGIDAVFTVEGESRPLPAGVEVVLLRAAQEGLANVRRHAEAASSVAVTLQYGPRHVTLRVGDDGAGFRTGAEHGYGLRAMRSRVEQEGGTFGVESLPGQGTTLSVTLRPSPAAHPGDPGDLAESDTTVP